jgi:uncharacterized protein YneR
MHDAYFETRFKSPGLSTALPPEFAIITAFATTGETWSQEENESADEELRIHLESQSCRMHRMTGYSPSSGHAESGWAVGLAFDVACDIGILFKQDAIYFVIEDQLYVSFCDHRRDLISVDIFSERLDAAGS